MSEKDIKNIISEVYTLSEYWHNYVINRIIVHRISRDEADITVGCVNDYGSWWPSGDARVRINTLRNATGRKVARIPVGEEIVIYR